MARRRAEEVAPSIAIVLDSTALRSHEKRLNLAPLRTLVQPAAKAGLTIRLPFVVLVELARGGGEEIERHLEAVARASRAFRQIGLDAPEWPRPDRKTATAAVEKTIRGLAKDADFEVLPTPEVEHGDLLRREFYRQKPFKPDGTGYRDALIWHTILDYAEAEKPERIYFVTANTTDFASKDGSLDSVLAGEAQEAGAKIVLVKDVHALLENHIGPMLAMVDAAIGKPVTAAFPQAAGDLEKALDEHLDGVTTLGELGDDAPDDEIVSRTGPVLNDVIWARDIGNGSILAELTATMHMVGSYDIGDGPRPMYEYESGTVKFTIQAVIDRNGKLVSAQVLPIEERDTDLGELDELERINLFSRYEEEEL